MQSTIKQFGLSASSLLWASLCRSVVSSSDPDCLFMLISSLRRWLSDSFTNVGHMAVKSGFSIIIVVVCATSFLRLRFQLHVLLLNTKDTGEPSFTKKQTYLFFPLDFADDFLVAMQVNHKL